MELITSLLQQAAGDVDIAADVEAQSSSHRLNISALHGCDSKMGNGARTTKSSKLTVQGVTKRLCAVHFDFSRIFNNVALLAWQADDIDDIVAMGAFPGFPPLLP